MSDSAFITILNNIFSSTILKISESYCGRLFVGVGVVVGVKLLVKLFISINNSLSMYPIAFKIHTLVQCHEGILYTKFHNSELIINEIIELFD